MYPKYQSVKFNPAFEAFFDNEKTLINVCNAALTLPGNQKIVAATYQKCGAEKMLQGHPIDFFFSIEAALQNGSKKLIALHKKSIFPSIDEEILKSNPTAEPAPYKTVFGPGDLYINHPTDYDYVIWFSFVNPRYFCLNTCQCVESIWDEYKVQYRKSATTQYIYYEIETFSKSLVDIKTDEDKWLYLLKNSPNSQENCPFCDPIFEQALSRITSAKLTMEFGERQKSAIYFQMDYFNRLNALQESVYAKMQA